MSDGIETRLRRLIEKRRAEDIAKKAYDDAKREADDLEADIWSMMEDTGQTSWNGDLGPNYGRYSFVRNSTVRSRVWDMDRLQEYLEQSAQVDEYIAPGPRKKALNDLVRRSLADGKPLPPGIDYSTTRYITATKKDK